MTQSAENFSRGEIHENEKIKTFYFTNQNFTEDQIWNSSIFCEPSSLSGMISQIGETIFVETLKWVQLENRENAFIEGERVVVFRETREKLREILAFADISDVPPIGRETSSILHREIFFRNYFEEKDPGKVASILRNLADFMEIDFESIKFSNPNSLMRSFDELLAHKKGVCQLTQFCPTSAKNIHPGARAILVKMCELQKNWAVMILGQDGLPGLFLNKVNQKQTEKDAPFFYPIARAEVQNIATRRIESTVLGILRSPGFLAGCENFASEDIFAEIKLETKTMRAAIRTAV